MYIYDIAVIGGGPGGYVAAIKAAQMGAKVALIEKKRVGGVCLNFGCIPTKTLLHSARLYKDFMNASDFGINLPKGCEPAIDWKQILMRKESVVDKLVTGVEKLLEYNKVMVYYGHGKVIDKNTIDVGGERIGCENLILATGSSPRNFPIEGMKDAFDKGICIDSRGAISLMKVPKSITILGGGVISIEFATLFNTLGSKVTILQRSDTILKKLDKDVRKLITRHLKKEGVKILTGVTLRTINEGCVSFERKGKEVSVVSDKILVSLGRQPNLEGLEELDLNSERGCIVTDEYMETNIKGVYAIGDITGKYMLAHVASAEGILAVESIMGEKNHINYRKIPSCIYSFPEVGVVGLTEEDAINLGYDVKTSIFPLSANGKALAEGDQTGFVKIVFESSGEVLGVHIVASHATDMIAEAVVALELNATVEDLARVVHPHPTLSEIVMEAAHGAVDHAIHSFE